MSIRRPLLIVDGDFFAHRAYHALPKSIRRSGNKGAGAILGFANFLLRFYETERPRAVLAGWDTLDEPTYRHEALEAYQAGRVFDDELVEQLAVLPQFVSACGFASAKAAGYEADDFLAAAVAREERRTRHLHCGERRPRYLPAGFRTYDDCAAHPGGRNCSIGPAEVRSRYGVDPRQVPDFIALRGDSSDRIPGAAGVGPVGAASLLKRYGTLEKILAAGRFAAQAEKLRLYNSSPPWTDPRLCLRCAIRSPPGRRPLSSLAAGNSTSWRNGWMRCPRDEDQSSVALPLLIYVRVGRQGR